MVGVMLLVYINPELLDQVSDVETEQVTTGIGGFLVRSTALDRLAAPTASSLPLLYTLSSSLSLPRVIKGAWLPGSTSSTRHCVL